MIRTWRKLSIVGAAALVLVACGSDDATNGTSDTSPDETTARNEATESSDPDAASVSGPETTSPPVASTLAPETTAVPAPDLPPPVPTVDELDTFAWTEIAAEAPWPARAGLRVVELGERLFLLGGRTPNQSDVPGDSVIWGDVWASEDDGAMWTELIGGQSAPWSARAYFQAVVKDDAIYVLGGQDFGLEPNPFCALLEQGLEPPPGLGIDPDAPCPPFLPTSNFFNDVWRSIDGVTWEQMTDAAPWAGRAGLSAAVLGDHVYVFAGSQNDDSSIIGPNGPARIYYNDVWRSADGAEWELMIDAAPWEPRAGAAVVVRDDVLYLFGGEDGFTCDPLPDCEPPYFNDVWMTSDGAEWTLVTESAGWSPRPGHVCELVGNQFVCFGGFGLVQNPTDVWVSQDGAGWTELTNPPWGSADPDDMKYDFDALTIEGEGGPRVLTFGGDRETFDFTDPENYLRIDNDVWAFAPS